MEFLSFFLVFLVAVLFSEVLRKLHLPWVATLIIGGMVLGSPLLDWEPTETIEFLGQIGLIFLMFMAGLETKMSGFLRLWRSVGIFSLLNAGMPFATGLIIGAAFGLDLAGAILLGIIFISSAVAVVIPVLENNKLLGTEAGRLVTSAAVLQDILALVLLAVFMQTAAPTAEGLPLKWFLILTPLSIILLRLIVPKIEKTLSLNIEEKGFERNVRSLLVILLGTVVIFELLGLHPIVGGFFAGLILSDSLFNQRLRDKVHTMSYGLFIPVFFIVIGATTDLTIFREMEHLWWLMLAIVGGSMAAKFFSGYLGARILNFTRLEGSIMGSTTMPQLSITLAIAYAGAEKGLFGELSEGITTSLVALTIVTSILVPIIVRYLAGKNKQAPYSDPQQTTTPPTETGNKVIK